MFAKSFARNREPIKRNYVSDLDRFLQTFDKKPSATSASRRDEEKKYARVFKLRDNPEAELNKKIWTDF